MKQSFLLAISLLIFLTFFYLLKEERALRPPVLQKGDSFIEGLKIIYRKNGRKDWVLTAKRADFSPNGDKARLSGIRMSLEDKGVTLYADGGLYRMADKNVSIDGNVTAQGRNFSLSSSNGEFDHASGTYKTGSDVRLDSSKFKVEGKGMSIDSTEQKVKILGNVKATFNGSK